MATPTSSLSHAVIATGGKQYLVSVGSEITVEKIEGKEGDSISLSSLVLAVTDKQETLSAKELAGASATAKVLEQGKGKKVRVFTFKSKKRQHRTLGHRQPFTRLKITALKAA